MYHRATRNKQQRCQTLKHKVSHLSGRRHLGKAFGEGQNVLGIPQHLFQEGLPDGAPQDNACRYYRVCPTLSRRKVGGQGHQMRNERRHVFRSKAIMIAAAADNCADVSSNILLMRC